MKYKVIRQTLLFVLCSGCFAVSGCKITPEPQAAKNRPFVEMLGTWSSGTVCRLNIAEINGQLFVRDFVAKNARLKEAQLTSKKEGIMINFSTQESTVLIRGSLSDGNMIIEEYCPDILHKTNNL